MENAWKQVIREQAEKDGFLHVRLPVPLAARLQREADARDVSLSVLVREIVRKAVRGFK